MKPKQTAGALVLMLAMGLAPATAQTGGITEPSAALQLSAQQRAEIYEAVGKSKLRTPPPPDTPVTVGAQIPPVTELYALPDSVTAEVPSAKFYRYTVAQNRVIIVDPTNLKVSTSSAHRHDSKSRASVMTTERKAVPFVRRHCPAGLGS